MDESGLVTAVSPGTATITATATNGTENPADNKVATCAVTVNPIIYTVTYKVVNGSWSDGGTQDMTEPVADGSKPVNVPTGMRAAEGYTGGAWDKDPAQTTITGATTFTYAFQKKPDPKLSVAYSGHVQVYGDRPEVSDGKTLGTVGESKRLEAIKARVSGIEGAELSYRGHLQGTGWTGWVAGDTTLGTTGESRRMEAVQMTLSGAEGWHVWYRVHSQNYGWLGWARDGESAGTAGQSLRVEALEVEVLPEGRVPDHGYAEDKASYVGAATGNVHLQGIGWTGARSTLSFGTTGQGRRLEAMCLSLANQPVGGGISYEVHEQGNGWTGVKADGAQAGTTGQSRRIEAVRVTLTGNMSKDFCVWYRVHSQNYGWLGWAHDGSDAGTTGLSKRAEAIEVQILPQDQVPNGYDPAVAACLRK